MLINKLNYVFLSFLLALPVLTSAQNKDETAAKKEVKAMLQSSFFEKLYSNTYYSLVDRMDSNGFLPESVTGAYEGMYCRTTGALVSLYLETGRLQEAEKNINCVLTAITANNMERVPHVIGKKDSKYFILGDEHQIDGQAHVLLAWARLALKRGHTDFEDKTWPLVSAIMKRTCDRTSFQYGRWSAQPGLIRNADFEHSREGRRWDTWDLLTQSFVGAALESMSAVAIRRGDTAIAADWGNKLKLLKDGIQKHLTTKREGELTYLEMLLPNSDGGVPYLGMGWVTLAPIAAGWEGADHSVIKNTVIAMQKTVMKNTNGITWMPTDGYSDGTVSNEIIGKGMAWEIDYARTEADYKRISEILKLINLVNKNQPLYIEGAWLEGNGHHHADRLSDKELAGMKDAVWKTKDIGNAEQCSWWCWAVARLRKDLNLSPEPKRLTKIEKNN